ncbi:MAG: hypothetical protein RLZZ153_1484 [Pseudomonadota bacterium]
METADRLIMKPHMIRGSRCLAGQKGQALWLSLALMLVVMLSLFAFYQGSRALDNKARVRQAADAAALSAATWRARVLNAVAYANRAILAQDLAVAQAVTLASWAGYAEEFAAHAQLLASIYPPAASVLAAASAASEQARSLAAEGAQTEIRWRADALSGHRAMLEQSQAMLLASADSFGLSAVANEIARANDGRIFAFVMGDEGAFSSFVTLQNNETQTRRTAELVTRSLDGFSGGSRELDLRLLPLPSSCAGQSTQLDRWTHWYRKRGGTELSADLTHWTAADTGSIHDWRRKRVIFGSCRDVEAIAVAGGFAQARSGDLLPSDAANPGRVLDNPGALARARIRSQAEHGSGFASYPGLGVVRDINPRLLQSQPFPRSALAVLAKMETDKSDASAGEPLGHGRLNLPVPHKLSPAWSLSAAEVYFRAPPGIEHSEQKASLFSPYWQARLVEPTEAQRQAAQSYASR